MPLSPLLHRIVQRQELSSQEAEQALDLVLSGSVSAPQLAGFLIALHMRGETAEELLGFARSMRKHCTRVPVSAPGPLLDTCGTGGDGANTFNISTATAFVVAGAGVRVAKHGNRSASSLCGSADVLEALGVNIQLTPEQVGQCIDEVGIGFLFAQSLHTSMKHAQEARRALRMRTVFNLLGPLTNPAGANCQLVGAPSVRAGRMLAEALAELGLERGFVVHGENGLDEVSISGATWCWEVRDGMVTESKLHPEDFGFAPAPVSELTGGDAAMNALMIRAVLDGQPGAPRDIVVVNSALALLAAGGTNNLRHAVDRATDAVVTGSAKRKLIDLVDYSHRLVSTAFSTGL